MANVAAKMATKKTVSFAEDVRNICLFFPPQTFFSFKHFLLYLDLLNERGCSQNYQCQLNAICAGGRCRCLENFRATDSGQCVGRDGKITIEY